MHNSKIKHPEEFSIYENSVVIKKTQMSTGLIVNRKTAVFLPTKQNT